MFAGALSLLQPARGHRAGTDAVLLAAALPESSRAIADLGAASGVVGLRAAQMNPEARVSLIEAEDALNALACLNIAAASLDERVNAHHADVFKLGAHAEWREAFDCVLTNPPYYSAKKMRLSQHEGKISAHIMPEQMLDAWLRNAATILQPKGQCVMVHTAEALPLVLNGMMKRFGDVRLRLIHASADKPAIRLLVKGTKGSRAPLTILPPLILNGKDGAFTHQAARLHQGEVRLSWSC